jgi:hypothetical protein
MSKSDILRIPDYLENILEAIDADFPELHIQIKQLLDEIK